MNSFFKRFFRDLFLTWRFFLPAGTLVLLHLLVFFIPAISFIPVILSYLFLFAVALEYILLFFLNYKPVVIRNLPERFSNGDLNKVSVEVKNRYPFKVHGLLIDEYPVQFQFREKSLRFSLKRFSTHVLHYTLTPTKRGEYHFGNVHLYVSTLFRLVERRFTFDIPELVKTYPSFIHLQKYELMVSSASITYPGAVKVKKIGHSTEFEQIREYVNGDDVRTINWKATARKGMMQVNVYTEEKSQHIYCIIDKGRVMKMPFDGLSLLDYAINASVALSHIALRKQDQVGMVTFSRKLDAFLKSDRKAIQMKKIHELLYNQQTDFQESDYQELFKGIRTNLNQRSMLLLFSNFESLSGLQRQLPYLKKIAKLHLLVVVFFENHELTDLATGTAHDVDQLYTNTVAAKFTAEKKIIAKELQNAGIMTILAPPTSISVSVIQKYIDLKFRQAI